MPLNLPTFYKRTGTAIVFAAVMLVGLLWNEWAFLALICLINTLCIYEYCKLMQEINKEAYWPTWLPYFIITAGLIVLVPRIFIERDAYSLVAAPLAAVPILPAILLLAGALAKRTFLLPVIQSLTSLLYITMSLFFFLELRLIGFILPIAVVFMIWTNDTMAYIVGSFIGKTPFSPISPKKTWEGTIGGGILTVLGAGIYGYLSHKYRPIDWIALGAIVAVFGTLGDLFESKLKRMADVKDSGTFMPGHGGALDRFDSLLVATPFVFVYVVIFMQ
jgi:phosphatidate cytidylyltransferase